MLYNNCRPYDSVVVYKKKQKVKEGSAAYVLNTDDYLYDHVYHHVYDALNCIHRFYL